VSLTSEDCIGERSPSHLLRSVNSLMWSRMEHNLLCHHSSYHWLALKLLDEGAVRNPGDLARDLGMTTGGVTRLVDALEDRKWIVRDRSASDRREIHLRLTPEGRDETRRVATSLIASWKKVLSVFADGEVEEFVRLLSLMKQGLQKPQVWQLEELK
jgi:DNA-binding MarR family transcriptional regulator